MGPSPQLSVAMIGNPSLGGWAGDPGRWQLRNSPSAWQPPGIPCIPILCGRQAAISITGTDLLCLLPRLWDSGLPRRHANCVEGTLGACWHRTLLKLPLPDNKPGGGGALAWACVDGMHNSSFPSPGSLLLWPHAPLFNTSLQNLPSPDFHSFLWLR
jgi:hypothetical protein